MFGFAAATSRHCASVKSETSRSNGHRSSRWPFLFLEAVRSYLEWNSFPVTWTLCVLTTIDNIGCTRERFRKAKQEMKIIPFRHSRNAMTLFEILLVLLVITVMVGFLLPSHGNRRSRSLTCLNNVRQINLALAMFYQDHANKYPMQLPESDGGTAEFTSSQFTYRHFRVLTNYLGRNPLVFICPADSKLPAANFGTFENTNLSYFINLDADSDRTNGLVFGDEFISVNGARPKGNPVVTWTMKLEWTKSHDKSSQPSGSLGLVDGSARRATNPDLQQLWVKSGQERARFSLPETSE
ncbi:MAG: prepilin-type N-terminal cleavage/methylation domain [Verrucomicrobiales bacterium]|nr:prepilin-type N-terminal cleavage/methylation domain [Verrucomicrobiales bacterium]